MFNDFFDQDEFLIDPTDEDTATTTMGSWDTGIQPDIFSSGEKPDIFSTKEFATE
jgi:hypothetical protein